MKFYESIPNRWFCIGRTTRWGTLLHSDGSRTPHRGEEYFLTVKLPWRRVVYCVNLDEPVQTRRFILRFKRGWAG